MPLIEKSTEILAALPAWLVALIVLVAVALFAAFAHWLVYRIVKRLFASRGEGPMRRLMARLNWPSRLIVIALAVMASLPGLPLQAESAALLQRIASLTVIGAVGWIFAALVNSGAEFVISRQDIEAEDNLAARRIQTQVRVLRRLLIALVVVVTASVMLMTIPAVRNFGISLFASAGVAGIVVGMAARPALSNLIAGLQIALTQPIRLDDVVIVEGEWGWIEEIAATYVVVRIWDWRRLVVPLSYFIEHPFQNWTRRSAAIIGSVTWHLDYGTPIALLREKLREFLEASPHWDGKVQSLQVVGSDRQTIEVRALMSAVSSPKAWDLRCEVREKMIAFLQKEHPRCLPRLRASVEGEGISVPESRPEP
jgi:small-conductance mechanosensitive channel